MKLNHTQTAFNLMSELKLPLAILAALLLIFNLFASSVFAKSDQHWIGNPICSSSLNDTENEQNKSEETCQKCCLFSFEALPKTNGHLTAELMHPWKEDLPKRPLLIVSAKLKTDGLSRAPPHQQK